jgi:hypothetical protein
VRTRNENMALINFVQGVVREMRSKGVLCTTEEVLTAKKLLWNERKLIHECLMMFLNSEM